MNPTLARRIAALFGVLAVAIGAFGAHGLKPLLEQNGTAATWEKGVIYHLAHAVALLTLALQPTVFKVPFVAFSLGITIFSGSLYLLAVTNQHWWGAITPIGGISFIVGWVCLGLKR